MESKRFTVQSGVPIPPIMQPARKGMRVYPYEEMDVGDSFFVPNKAKNTMSSHISTVGKKLGKKFVGRLCYMKQNKSGAWVTCEADADGAILGIGVWRTE